MACILASTMALSETLPVARFRGWLRGRISAPSRPSRRTVRRWTPCWN